MTWSFLNKKAIAGLRAHQYKSGCSTPFDFVMYKYFWNPILELIPLWMAPNLLLLISFHFYCMFWIFFTVMCNLSLNPTLLGDVSPSWVFVVSSVCFFFYTTMDALDGGQARRTKSSSPLGQLFDHGCDGILSGIAPILQAHALGLGLSTSELPLLIGVTQVLFFLGMWEEKYTGVCRTTILGVIGTTEFMLFFVAHQFIAGMFPVVSHSLKSSLFFVTLCGAGFSACTSLYYVTKKKSLTIALPEVMAILTFNIAFYFANLDKTSFAPYLVQAFTNSFLIIRMIISSMSKTPFATVQWAVAAPMLIFALGTSPTAMSKLLVFWLIAFSFFFVGYLTSVCSEIAKGLGIEVFRIKSGGPTPVAKSS